MDASNQRPYWNMDIESQFNTPAITTMQFEKLKQQIKRLRLHAPYYTRLFEQHAIHEDTLDSFEQFRERVPIFTKQHYRELYDKYDGNILEIINQTSPVNAYEDLYLMATTSGTSGEPSPYPMSEYDAWEFYGEIIARYCWRAGIRKQDRILMCYGLSMVIAGIPSIIGNFKIGSMVIPVGAQAGSERILKMARHFKPTAMMGTPSLALYLIEQCPKILGIPVSELGIKTIICGGEPGAGLPEVRQRIESAYGCKLYDMGAALGISCDYPEYQGMHSVGDDFMIFELVDPNTKVPLPFEHGQRGEAVYTTLSEGAWTWVRNSPGDIMEIATDDCPCGRSGFRYRVVGRVDDMLKVKGVMVYPNMIRQVVETFVPKVTGQMLIALNEPPPRVVPPLIIKLEYSNDFPVDQLEYLANEISETMSQKIKLRPKIIWLKEGDLERSTYKSKTFERNY